MTDHTLRSDKDAGFKEASSKSYWRSVAHRSKLSKSQLSEQLNDQLNEFPQDLKTLSDRINATSTDVSRRGFMGASLALAGTTTLASCIRKPYEKIVPYAMRPEDLIPGKPTYFATSTQIFDRVVGLHVESQDGRPTKIEGNPNHPLNRGTTGAHVQSLILDLYDDSRLKRSLHSGSANAIATELSASARDKALKTIIDRYSAAGASGRGLAFLVRQTMSPTEAKLLRTIADKMPNAAFYCHDESASVGQRDALNALGLAGHTLRYSLAGVTRIASFDADFLGLEGDVESNSIDFAAGRKAIDSAMASGQTSAKAAEGMSRLYVAEPMFTSTGMSADHRLRASAERIVVLMSALVGALGKAGGSLPPGISSQTVTRLAASATAEELKWVNALAKDLRANSGKSLLVCGRRQPAMAHALAFVINGIIGAMHEHVEVRKTTYLPTFGSDAELIAHVNSSRIETLVVTGGDPLFEFSGELKADEAFSKLTNLVVLGGVRNQTSASAAAKSVLSIPKSHFLESWGDWIASDGTYSVQQPLIAPLYESLSAIDLLGRFAMDSSSSDVVDALTGQIRFSAYDEVQKTFRGRSRYVPKDIPEGADRSHSANMALTALGQKGWNQVLHDGAVGSGRKLQPKVNWDGFQSLISSLPHNVGNTIAGHYELLFAADNSVFDGRYASNAWLQELPDPATKLTWDNAAIVGPSTAASLGVASEDWIELTINREGAAGVGKLRIAVWVVPGVADNTIVLPLGYGKSSAHPVADKVGFNVSTVRLANSPAFYSAPVSVSKLRGDYKLACTQEHGTLIEPRTKKKREIVLEETVAGYKQNPNFVSRAQLMKDEDLTSLWEPPNETKGQQWGMVIDLNSCTGCNACTVACQAENNIPVVGKERVLDGREMHWIRLDRYFSGDTDDAEVVFQPMACHHCETAPCESVCPVAATVHSPEGLNDMVYNRCVGTRYCSNNCPVKVRRYNFFAYQKENRQQNKAIELQRNPDVTVRFRGVMEKCTYCVQRISEAKIAAKVDGKSVVDDGAIVPACQQACPTQAIVFGNVNDPNSRVSKLKKIQRNYAVLKDLNLHARTTYLAKIRNPNPALSPAVAPSHEHQNGDHGHKQQDSQQSAPEHHG